MGIMGKNKTSGVKKRLYKKINQNESVSAWIVLKTKRKVRTNPKKRYWRQTSLKVK
jgi:large subunit ribosomal protein L39e